MIDFLMVSPDFRMYPPFFSWNPTSGGVILLKAFILSIKFLFPSELIHALFKKDFISLLGF